MSEIEELKAYYECRLSEMERHYRDLLSRKDAECAIIRSQIDHLLETATKIELLRPITYLVTKDGFERQEGEK